MADPLRQHLYNVINKTWNFSGKLQTTRDHEMNAVVGLAAEAGEVLDEFKKEWFHAYDPERKNNIREELGDLFYYLIKVMELCNLSLDEILAYNKNKLYKRHGIEDKDEYFD